MNGVKDINQTMLFLSIGNVEISIIRSNRKTISIEIKPDKVIVRAPEAVGDKEVVRFLELKKNWIEKHLKVVSERQKNLNMLSSYSEEEIKSFVKKAKEIIPMRVEFYAQKAGVTYNRITFRCQRTRWGSCSSKGNLNFNCLLVLLPADVMDSVIVHELCHRKQMNHSAKFYAEVEKVFPEYQRCSKWLKQNGGLYLSRIPK